MSNVLQFRTNPRDSREIDADATPKDYQQMFVAEMTNLFRLSLDLTGDVEKAKKCLILAMRDCFEKSAVSKKSARLWARRMVVRNAVCLVLGTANDIQSETGSDLHLQPSEYQIEALRGSVVIQNLPDFDRLVFVICVLERYSILDCALLLRRSPKDVDDARVRSANRVILAEERDHLQQFTVSRTGTCGVWRDERSELDGSYGTILD